jgi:hypothetical protein
MDEKERKEAKATLLKEMQVTAARMRELIVGMPPHDLLGYIYAQHMLKAIADQRVSAGKQPEVDGPDDLINQNQFLLEYVHAVLASDAVPDDMKFDETKCAELLELSRKLRDQAMFSPWPHQREQRPAYSAPTRLTSNFARNLLGSCYAETGTKSWKASFTTTFWLHTVMSLEKFTVLVHPILPRVFKPWPTRRDPAMPTQFRR